MSNDTEKDEYEAAVGALHQKIVELRQWVEETFEVSGSAEISFVAVLLEAGLIGLQDDWISGSVAVLHEGCPHAHVAIQDDADNADLYATLGSMEMIQEQFKDRIKAAAFTSSLQQAFATQQAEPEDGGSSGAGPGNDLN